MRPFILAHGRGGFPSPLRTTNSGQMLAVPSTARVALGAGGDRSRLQPIRDISGFVPNAMQPLDVSAVGQQRWEWLDEVARRLDLAIEVVDARNVPVLPPAPTAASGRTRELLRTMPGPLEEALSAARGATNPVPIDLDAIRGECTGIARGGVLLVAKTATAQESAGDAHEELQHVAAWLARAVADGFGDGSQTISEEAYRVGSLERILNDAAASDSPRRVLGAFVESLRVWENVIVHVYAAAARSGFMHVVSPVGVLASSVPVQIADAAVNSARQITRLTRTQAESVGFSPEPGDSLWLPLPAGTSPTWLIVVSENIDGAEQGRLSFYARILRDTLETVFERVASRLAAAMPRQPLAPHETLDPGARAALARLADAVGGNDATLIVTTVTGIRALAIGNTSLVPSTDDDEGSDRLVVVSTDATSVMTVAIARDHGPFTAFEHDVVKAGVSVLHAWIQAGLGPTHELERRRRVQPLESVLDQLAMSSVGAGLDASVIVASINSGLATPELMQSWLGSIRAQIRPGDFAGLLSDTEIAVLLCDTSADQASAVSARLQHLVPSDTHTDVVIQPTIGAFTSSAELPFTGSLVGAARARAAAFR
jgi:hypothetical protein